MTPSQAAEILRSRNWVTEDGDLYSLGTYISVGRGAENGVLDSEFTADELEAIAMFMREPDAVLPRETP